MINLYPLYFEDVNSGVSVKFQTFEITREMVDKHVELYGWDFPPRSLDEVIKHGLVASPIPLSKVAGQGGEADWLMIKSMLEYTAKFHKWFKVGDLVTAITEVTGKEDVPKKKYGYVFGHQVFLNQNGELCYERDLKYAVHKKSIE